jgi:peroxidase
MLVSANGITTKLDACSSFSIRRLDIIDGVKATLEEACPNTVSCADIIAMAGREAVAYAAGPRITIPLGRRDSTYASTSEAFASLPQPNISMDQFMNLFATYGMSLPDSVAIMGSYILLINSLQHLEGLVFWLDDGRTLAFPLESCNYVENM